MTNTTKLIRSLKVSDTIAYSKERMGEELTILDNISWKEIIETPTQVGFLFIALCTDGSVTFNMGETIHEMRKGDMIISFGEHVFQREHTDNNFQAKVVVMSREFAQNCIIGLDRMWPYLLYVMQHPVLHLNEEEVSWVLDCYDLVCRHLNKPHTKFLRDSTISLVRAFYFEVCDLLDRRDTVVRTDVQTRQYSIFDSFIRLVSENFKRERSVEWYSSELCVTSKHLSEVVKRVSGRTAGQWIATFVITEIKQLLRNSSYSIKDIAKEMNFANQSFLGKYFKNIEGYSPTDFRRY